MKAKFLILVFLASSTVLFSQDASLYSFIGFGQTTEVGNFTSFGLGKNGIANSTNFDINLSNPAGLSSLDRTLFGFSARYSSNKAVNSNSEVKIDDGDISTVAIAFPLIPENKFNFAAGFAPLSQSNFVNVNSSKTFNNISYKTTKEVEGGFANGFLSFSYGINKTSSVGMAANYIFGTINNYDSLIFMPVDSNYYQNSFSQLSTSAKGIKLNFGYHANLTENINLGIIFSPQTTLTSQQDLLENFAGVPETTSTRTGKIILPSSFGIGLNYKTLPFNLKFDFVSQNWENFKIFDQTIKNYKTSNRFTFAAEYISPKKVSYTAQQVKYYIGASYYQTPWKVNNTEINEVWLSAGASFPLSIETSMNLNFSYGKRGVKSIVEENVYQISINILASALWFIQIPYE